MIKLSFTGDVTCDRPMLKAAKKKKYNFSGMLENVKEEFENSDLVVGNLETIFGSDKIKYNHFTRYNSPDTLLDELSCAGFNVLTTANNHCFDGDEPALARTIEMLERKEIFHTGTFKEHTEKRYIIVNVKNIKIAVLAYTYGLNDYKIQVYPENINSLVNSLTSIRNYPSKELSILAKLLYKMRIGTRVKRLLKIPTIDAYQDIMWDGRIDTKIMNEISEQIKKARSESDLLIFSLHAGGQFNEKPGEYVEYLMSFLEENDVDIVIGHHPHTIQKAYTKNGRIFAYSLGGLSMSPSGDYVYHQCKPEYSIIINAYLDEESKTIKKTTYSFVKAKEDKNHFLRVVPVYDLYSRSSESEKRILESDITDLIERITGIRPNQNIINKEYEL